MRGRRERERRKGGWREGKEKRRHEEKDEEKVKGEEPSNKEKE